MKLLGGWKGGLKTKQNVNGQNMHQFISYGVIFSLGKKLLKAAACAYEKKLNFALNKIMQQKNERVEKLREWKLTIFSFPNEHKNFFFTFAKLQQQYWNKKISLEFEECNKLKWKWINSIFLFKWVKCEKCSMKEFSMVSLLLSEHYT